MEYCKQFLLIVLAFIWSIRMDAQSASPASSTSGDGYEVTGYLNGIKDGDKVVAVLCYPVSWRMDRRDSAFVKNGVFHIKGTVPEGPRLYWLLIAGKFKMHLAIANNEKIFLHSNEDIGNSKNAFLDCDVAVEGAKYHTSMMMLLSAWFYYDRAVKNVKKYARRVVDSVGFDGQLLTGIYGAVDNLNQAMQIEIFTKRPNQLDKPITLGYALLEEGIIEVSKHASFLADGYNGLSDVEKKGVYGKYLEEYAKLSVGQVMPNLDFRYPSADGTNLSIKDVVSKGKVTLINFWGTNSPLVKRMHDELRVMYKMFKDKGLNILAISSDDYTEAWKEHLDQEKYPWYNVLDKKGNIVDTVYHEFTVTKEKQRNVTNVLLDSQGKILAWDVEGIELQWYLWKNLQQQ